MLPALLAGGWCGLLPALLAGGWLSRLVRLARRGCVPTRLLGGIPVAARSIGPALLAHRRVIPLGNSPSPEIGCSGRLGACFMACRRTLAHDVRRVAPAVGPVVLTIGGPRSAQRPDTDVARCPAL